MRNEIVGLLSLAFYAALICGAAYGLWTLVEHFHKQSLEHKMKIESMMAECKKEKKEYECYALIKAPDEQRQAIDNAALAAGVAAGAVAGAFAGGRK